MVDHKQQFIATVDNKMVGALIHDIVQIQNNITKMKTNFNYTLLDLLGIVIMGSLLDFRLN